MCDNTWKMSMLSITILIKYPFCILPRSSIALYYTEKPQRKEWPPCISGLEKKFDPSLIKSRRACAARQPSRLYLRDNIIVKCGKLISNVMIFPSPRDMEKRSIPQITEWKKTAAFDRQIGNGYDFLFGQYKNRALLRDYEIALTAIWEKYTPPRVSLAPARLYKPLFAFPIVSIPGYPVGGRDGQGPLGGLIKMSNIK